MNKQRLIKAQEEVKAALDKAKAADITATDENKSRAWMPTRSSRSRNHCAVRSD
jgi:hypothetical protein